MAEEEITVRVRVRGRQRASVELNILEKDVKDVGDSSEKSSRKLNRFSASMGIFRARLLAIPATLAAVGAGIGFLIQGVSALTGGAVALTSALTPALGAIAAAPQALSVFAQGMGVAKLAMQGVTDAVGGLNEVMDTEKLALLSGPAQKFAFALNELKEPIRVLQRSAQRNLFPGLTEGLTAAAPLLKTMRPIVAGTARALGSLASQAGNMFASPVWRRDIATIGRDNVTLIRILGTAGLDLADALRDIVIAARPLTMWLAQTASRWASNIAAWAAAGRASGTLARTFERTRFVLSQLFSIGGALARTLGAIGRAAYPLGRTILVELNKQAERLATWSTSTAGQATLRKYFDSLQPTLWEAGRLVRDIVKAFFDLGRNPALPGLIAQLRLQLLPALVQAIHQLNEAFGPVMIDALTNFTRLFGNLAGESGPLTLYVRALSMIASALNAVFQHVPGLATAATYTIALYLAITRLVGAYRFLAASQAISTALAWKDIGLRIQLIALAVREAIAKTAVAVATRTAAIAQGLLNLVMMANPIVLIIAAIVAAAAAFYLLYTRVKWVRTAVANVWNWIRTNWPLLVTIMTGPVGFIAQYVIRNFGRIVSFIRSMPGKIAGAARGMFDGIKNAFRSAINWIIRGWNSLKLGIPKIKMPGPLPDIPGFSVGTPNIPLLAAGGMVRGGGLGVVGDEGPELLSVNRGVAAVTPLAPRGLARRPVGEVNVPEPARGDFNPTGEGVARRPVILEADGYEIARLVERRRDDAKARK